MRYPKHSKFEDTEVPKGFLGLVILTPICLIFLILGFALHFWYFAFFALVLGVWCVHDATAIAYNMALGKYVKGRQGV